MMVVVRVAVAVTPCPCAYATSSSSSSSSSKRNRNRNHGRLPPNYLFSSSSPVPSPRLLFSTASSSSSSSSSSSASLPQMAASAPAPAVDVFQIIHAHQEAAARLAPVVEVRTLLYQTIRGVLSTLSLEHEGYPSGSMVDFACHEDGSPILALSSLAVHSKNLSENAKCCLLVAKDPEDRTDTVITLYGDAIPITGQEREQVRAAYLKRHPDAFWVDFGDFRFIQIKPRFIRYVSGVATALLGSGEFTAEEFRTAKVDPISQFAKPIMSHMNKDHSDDTKLIVQHSTSVKVDSAYILDVDSLGFYVKAEYDGRTMKLRIPFPRPAQERKDVKTLIVEMLQAAKAGAVPTSE